MAEEKLDGFLVKGKDWERLKTSIPGVFVLKLPKYKSSPPRLAVELNPTDASGRPTKRRGLILRSRNELKEFKELFQLDKLLKLLGLTDAVNPKGEAARKDKEESVIEL